MVSSVLLNLCVLATFHYGPRGSAPMRFDKRDMDAWKRGIIEASSNHLTKVYQSVNNQRKQFTYVCPTPPIRPDRSLRWRCTISECLAPAKRGHYSSTTGMSPSSSSVGKKN